MKDEQRRKGTTGKYAICTQHEHYMHYKERKLVYTNFQQHTHNSNYQDYLYVAYKSG